ncbi:hypothetical protein AWB73_00140 [Caballeronia turbans]|nr:hypothetical protein AWB73_00140 [Caballeronia turbans]
MKRLLTLSLLLLSAFAFGATTTPVQLLNPTGSTAGQVILSTGATTAPAWGNVSLSGLSAIAANTVLANATAASAKPTAFAMPSCSTTSSALTWTTNTGFGCNTSVATTSFVSSAITAATGRLLNVQVFSASGTYTPTSGTTSIVVTVQAPGGGSGGVAATSTSQSAVSVAGGSGSYAKVRYTSGFSGATVTIGAVGAAGTAGNNSGGAGGTTSFGSLVSCPGGVGGAGSAALTGVFLPGAPSAASACTITGGTTEVSIAGTGGSTGIVISPGFAQTGGTGGNSPLGHGGQSGSNTSGRSGTGYGSGPSGIPIGQSTAATAGLAGQPGLIIVEEYN